MTKKKMIACTFSAMAFAVFGASAHADTVSGAAFRPITTVDAASISYAQGAATSTDANNDRQVIADMGWVFVENNQLDVLVRWVGNNVPEQCYLDTRKNNGVAQTLSLSRTGFPGPNDLRPPGNPPAPFFMLNDFYYVSLRCTFPAFGTNGQMYILGATVSAPPPPQP